MPNQDYWKKRFEMLNESLLKDGMDYYDEAEKSFRRAQNAINKDIAAWYQRFAENNKISMQEAKKLLKGGELEEFHWTVEEYIKRGKENGISADWSRQLENASAKFHISRLEALKIQAQQHLEELYGNYLDGLDRTMRRTYQDAYYKTAYTMQEGYHTGFEVASIPESAVDAVIKKPWAADGLNFSDRIWRDKNKLIRTLQDELTQGLIRGDRQDDIVRRFAKRMGVSLSNAGRLIATESAFFAAKGELDNMKELGVEKYQFIATLDRRTSDICRSMDMKIIPVKDFQPGVTAPPLHCWCRSCTVPYMGEAEGLRAARDEEGKTTYIPDMPYKDWKEIYVDKKKTLEEWMQEKRTQRINTLRENIANTDLATCSVNDVVDLGKEMNALFDIENHLGDKKYLKAAFGNFREMGGEVKFEKGCAKDNKKQLSEAFSVYPKAWSDYLNDSGRLVYTKKVERGFFYPAAVKQNGKEYATKFKNYKEGYITIHMDGARNTTPFHEIGHMVEYFNQSALRISKTFLQIRTVGEKSKFLRDLFLDDRYGDEVTKPDDFISPYIGKEYSWASEVLSMGLEQIFSPTYFLKRIDIVDGRAVIERAKITDDEEYFQMILGLILTA